MTPEQERECERLKALFNQRAGMTQREFVKKYDLGSPSNLGQYLNGRRPLSVALAARLAQALGVDIEEFSPRLARDADALGISVANVSPSGRPSSKKIPVLTYVQAGLLSSQGQVPDPAACVDACDFIYADSETPNGCFALVIKGRSMEPVFLEGDIILVDPSAAPRAGDYVVASRVSPTTGDVEGTFKKYLARGVDDYGREVFELKPLNEAYPTINSARERVTVVGVMIEHRRKYRR